MLGSQDYPDAPDGLVIRPAQPGEAGSLSALAMRSKAHWGYDQAFLEAVRPLLEFTEEDLALASPRTYALVSGGEIVGVYQLVGELPEGELDDFWLDPRLIGRGLGRRLFEHALLTARELGFESLLIESDPNAEGFYRAMGAVRVGEQRSPSGRTLPLLRVAV
jgi:GNAT superfamily N-acetyltransferase